MLNLLFLDLGEKERKLRQRELDTIYSTVMEEGPNLFNCVKYILFF